MIKDITQVAREALGVVTHQRRDLELAIFLERKNTQDFRALASTLKLEDIDAFDITELPPLPKADGRIAEYILDQSTFNEIIPEFCRLKNLMSDREAEFCSLKRIVVKPYNILLWAIWKGSEKARTLRRSFVNLSLESMADHFVMAGKVADKDKLIDRTQQSLIKINTAEIAGDLLHDIKDSLMLMETPLFKAERCTEGCSAKISANLNAIRTFHGKALSLSTAFLEQVRDNDLKLSEIEAQEVSKPTISHFRTISKDYAISFVEFPSDPIFILADKYRFIRALHNIIANAVHFAGRRKYGSAGGGKHGVVEVYYSKDRGEGVGKITVRDNGPGFEDPRRAGELGYTTRHGGSGMGIAIAGAILREHGGRLEINSSQGAGARVSLVVPLARK